MPADLAQQVTDSLDIPVIGIGAPEVFRLTFSSGTPLKLEGVVTSAGGDLGAQAYDCVEQVVRRMDLGPNTGLDELSLSLRFRSE